MSRSDEFLIDQEIQVREITPGHAGDWTSTVAKDPVAAVRDAAEKLHAASEEPEENILTLWEVRYVNHIRRFAASTIPNRSRKEPGVKVRLAEIPSPATAKLPGLPSIGLDVTPQDPNRRPMLRLSGADLVIESQGEVTAEAGKAGDVS